MGSWSSHEIQKFKFNCTYILQKFKNLSVNTNDIVEIFYPSPFLKDKSGIDFDH